MEPTAIDVVLWVPHREAGDPTGQEEAELLQLREGRLPISDDGHIWVGGFDHARCVMRECEPLALSASTRQFSAYYAIVNQRPAEPQGLTFDPDGRLLEVLALSRLVRPTPISVQYAARVRFRRSGLLDVIPYWPPWLAYSHGGRDWLTKAEWEEVARLVSAWRKLPKRVERIRAAVSYREHAARQQHLHVRWVLLVTAIESLVGIYRRRRTGQGKSPAGRGVQFERGLCKLARSVGEQLTKRDAQRAWKRRSSLVHGAGWPAKSIKDGLPSDSLYQTSERILDRALAKALLDPKFRARFRSDSALAAWL